MGVFFFLFYFFDCTAVVVFFFGNFMMCTTVEDVWWLSSALEILISIINIMNYYVRIGICMQNLANSEGWIKWFFFISCTSMSSFLCLFSILTGVIISLFMNCVHLKFGWVSTLQNYHKRNLIIRRCICRFACVHVLGLKT